MLDQGPSVSGVVALFSAKWDKMRAAVARQELINAHHLLS